MEKSPAEMKIIPTEDKAVGLAITQEEQDAIKKARARVWSKYRGGEPTDAIPAAESQPQAETETTSE